MANTCINLIRIEGPEKDLLALKDHINAVRKDEKARRYRNLYLLLLRLGYPEAETKKFDIREDFTGGDAEIENGILKLDTESAWSFQCSGWEAVRKKFPAVSIYYLAEELGCCVFETNDTAGRHFPYKYCLDWWDEKLCDGETEYFNDDCSLIEYVHDHFDSSVGTFEQAKKALEAFGEKDNLANLTEIQYNSEYELLAEDDCPLRPETRKDNR